MRRDRGWDRDRPRDWDRDRDRDHRDRDRSRDRDRERDRDRSRVSRMRPEPSPLRKPAANPGPRHPSGGSSSPPPSRHLWVGNLASTVSEKMLFEEFQRYGDVESLNHLLGRSYAFVNFSREQDAVRALRALQGIRFDGSPIKIEFSKGDMEPSDILWIGFPANLNVDETALRTVFAPFGEVIRIATFPGRSYAFVHYRDVASASRARETLNGKLFNNPRVHISFARSDAFNDASGSGGARRSPPRRLDRDPDFGGYRRDFHSRPMSPRDKTTVDWSHVEQPIRRGSGNIHFDEGHGPSFQRKQRLDYDEPHPLPAPFERRQVSYSDDPYPLQLPPHERRRGSYPDDSHILPPPVDHRRGPEFDDYYPLQKRMRASPDPIGDLESELPEYPFDELSRGRPTRLSQLNDGFAGVRAGPGGGLLDVSMGKFSSSNTKIVKEVWKWEGVIAKGGATVCQARCFPVGKTLDFMLPEILNCSARTNLEMLSRHYYQAAASWVVFFAPRSDADIASYNDFMHYLTEKQRVAVAKLEEKVSLFLVPPSEFTEKVLKVPGKLSISGLVLRFNQQDTDQDPGPTFNQPASKPGHIIEDSLFSKTRNSPDFRSHVGPSSGNFTSGNFSSSFTPRHIPPKSIQQQNHGSSALGFSPQPPLNPIQQQIQGPGISGFVPPQPNPVQQEVHEVGTSGLATQPPTNPLQQQNLEQGYASFQRPPPTNPLQQQNLELGPTSFQRPPPHNTLKQQNLERSPIGFPHPLPPNSTQQQNLELYNSGFPQQPPSNATWQQTQQPLSAGGYYPVQNNSFSGNFQLRPEFTSNYMAAPPLPPGPPPPRAVVLPSIAQPVSMPFQFGTNYPNYEQGVQEQIHNQNPNPNVSPIMNSILQPSYTSQAPPVQGQIQNQNPNSYLNPNPNSNVNLMMNNIPQPSYTTLAPMQEQIQNQNPNTYPNPNPNSNMNPMTNSIPPPSYTSQAPVPPGFWGPSVGQGVATGPPAVQQQQQKQQQQQQQQQQGGGGSGGAGSNNAIDPDRQKRLEATMQLAAVLLQQMQQQASSGTDKQ